MANYLFAGYLFVMGLFMTWLLTHSPWSLTFVEGLMVVVLAYVSGISSGMVGSVWNEEEDDNGD